VPKEGGELKDLPDGGLKVPMRCEACEGASEMALVLSPKKPKLSACTHWEGADKSPEVFLNALLT
jgi:hypothetical protein